MSLDSKLILNSKYYSLKSNSGQVLVEATVALSILIIGYISILALLNRSLGQSSLIADQTIATYLASEGLEVVRNLIDAQPLKGEGFGNGISDGSYEVDSNTQLETDVPEDGFNPGSGIAGSLSATPLRFDPIEGYNYIVGEPTRFFRTIQIKNPNPNQIQAISIIQWKTKGGGSNEVRLEDFFFPKRSIIFLP